MYKGGITIETTEIKEILWNNYKQLYAKKKKLEHLQEMGRFLDTHNFWAMKK